MLKTTTLITKSENMKLKKLLLFVILLQELTSSCTKEYNKVRTISISAVTVVNAIANTNPLIADFSGVDSVAAYYSTTPYIGYGSFQEYSIPSGNVPTVICQVTDTLHPFFRGMLNLQPNGIYSLFLSAADTSQKTIDTVLTMDKPPYHSGTDSTASIRFINLSPGSSPMSIHVQNNANSSVVSNLPYRSVSSFKTFPATFNITQYVFIIRDVESDDSLTSCTYNVSPFQNVTVVVNGVSSNNTLSTFIVNNF
jgi:hypothetical protein